MSPINSNPKSRTNKATVRFTSKVRIRNVSSHREWSREEKSNCWYTSQDVSSMKAQTIFLIKNAVGHWEELRAFGLEAPQFGQARRAHIEDAKIAVLMEQERLWKDGGSSQVNVLSVQSMWASQKSRDDARRRADIVSAIVHGSKIETQPRVRLWNGPFDLFDQRSSKKLRSHYVSLSGRKDCKSESISKELSLTSPRV